MRPKVEVPKQYRVCCREAGRCLQIFCLFPPFPDVGNTLDQLTTQVEGNRFITTVVPVPRQTTVLVAVC